MNPLLSAATLFLTMASMCNAMIYTEDSGDGANFYSFQSDQIVVDENDCPNIQKTRKLLDKLLALGSGSNKQSVASVPVTDENDLSNSLSTESQNEDTAKQSTSREEQSSESSFSEIHEESTLIENLNPSDQSRNIQSPHNFFSADQRNQYPQGPVSYNHNNGFLITDLFANNHRGFPALVYTENIQTTQKNVRKRTINPERQSIQTKYKAIKKQVAEEEKLELELHTQNNNIEKLRNRSQKQKTTINIAQQKLEETENQIEYAINKRDQLQEQFEKMQQRNRVILGQIN